MTNPTLSWTTKVPCIIPNWEDTKTKYLASTWSNGVQDKLLETTKSAIDETLNNDNIPMWVKFTWWNAIGVYTVIYNIYIQNNILNIMTFLNRLKGNQELRNNFSQKNNIDIEDILELLESDFYPKKRTAENTSTKLWKKFLAFREWIQLLENEYFNLTETQKKKIMTICKAYNKNVKELAQVFIKLKLNEEEFRNFIDNIKNTSTSNSIKKRWYEKFNDIHNALWNPSFRQ